MPISSLPTGTRRSMSISDRARMRLNVTIRLIIGRVGETITAQVYVAHPATEAWFSGVHYFQAAGRRFSAEGGSMGRQLSASYLHPRKSQFALGISHYDTARTDDIRKTMWSI